LLRRCLDLSLVGRFPQLVSNPTQTIDIWKGRYRPKKCPDRRDFHFHLCTRKRKGESSYNIRQWARYIYLAQTQLDRRLTEIRIARDPIRLPRELPRDGLSNALEKSSCKSTDYIPLAESDNLIDYLEKGC